MRFCSHSWLPPFFRTASPPACMHISCYSSSSLGNSFGIAGYRNNQRCTKTHENDTILPWEKGQGYVCLLATFQHPVNTKARCKPWLVSMKFSSTLALLQPADAGWQRNIPITENFGFQLWLLLRNVQFISYDLFTTKGVSSDIGPAGSVLITMTQYFDDVRNYTYKTERTFTLSSAVGLGSYIKWFLEVGLNFLFKKQVIGYKLLWRGRCNQVLLLKKNLIAPSSQSTSGTERSEIFQTH